MRSTLEKALEALINEDQATADKLFHDYILERSRRIHESIRQGEEVVLEDIMDDELTEGKSFKRNKDEDADDKKKQDKQKRDSRKPVDESEELEEGKSFKRNDDDEEAEDKKKQDKERKDAAKNKRKVAEGEDLEGDDEEEDSEDLDEGKSFKRNKDEDADEKKKQDQQKRKDRKPVDESEDLTEADESIVERRLRLARIKADKIRDKLAKGNNAQLRQDLAAVNADIKRYKEIIARDQKVDEGKLEAVQGDDGTLTITHTPEASVAAEATAPMGMPPVPPAPIDAPLDVPELPAPETDIPDMSGMDDFAGDADVGLDDEMGDDLGDDEFDSLGESLAMELEKILVNTKDGDFATGGNAKVEKHSPVPNVAAADRMKRGEPVEVENDEHNGFDREPAPQTKTPNPHFANAVKSAKDAMSPAKTGGKALLNQGGEDKSAKSPVGGK